MNSRATFAPALILAAQLAHAVPAHAADPTPTPTAALAAAPAPDAAPAPHPETDPETASVPPPAPPPNVAPSPDRPSPPTDDHQLGSHQSHWFASVGYRVAFVGNAGLDPFSDNDSVPQVSLSAGRTLFASGNWSMAALALWDWGSLESTARGAKTDLTLNRITLGAEGRYHFFRRFYVFGRLAPGALSSSATLMDNVTGVEQRSSSWVFAGDLSAGANVEFAGENRGASQRPRAWVGFDAGYGFATSSDLTFKPENEETGPVRTQPQQLGQLAVRGGFLRMSLGGSY